MRDYTIRDGKLAQFIDEWRRQIVPLRRAHGYQIEAAWSVPAENRFVWLLSLEVPPAEWEARNDAYYADPARASMDPDPARLLEAQRRGLVLVVAVA
ncbi:MAG: NIPSNAP family protein [Chloroflexota bacterium]|nr:NIPSNAP family protein [Chloroflexota bacterium]